MTARNTARRHKGSTRQHRSVKVDWRAATVMRHWRQHGRAHFVYFIREGDDGAIKIGVAGNPVKRMEEFQCGNSHDLQIVAVILGDIREESDLHAFWGHAHVRGEWFGKGYQQAIIEKAQHIADEQIAAHQAGAVVDGRQFVQVLFSKEAM